MALQSVAIKLNYATQVIDMRINILYNAYYQKKCTYKIRSVFIVFEFFKHMTIRKHL